MESCAPSESRGKVKRVMRLPTIEDFAKVERSTLAWTLSKWGEHSMHSDGQAKRSVESFTQRAKDVRVEQAARGAGDPDQG
jgi:hypothetical protein